MKYPIYYTHFKAQYGSNVDHLPPLRNPTYMTLSLLESAVARCACTNMCEEAPKPTNAGRKGEK